MGYWSEEIMGGDMQWEIRDDICIAIFKWNPYKGKEVQPIPVKLVQEASQVDILNHVQIFADSMGKYRHEALENGLQVFGQILLDAKVKAKPAIRKQILKACKEDSWAKKDKKRREIMKEFIQKLEETI